MREAFVALNKRKTITLTGIVNDVEPGGFVQGWFFYLETPDAPVNEEGGLAIAVTLDKHQFPECAFEQGEKPEALPGMRPLPHHGHLQVLGWKHGDH